MSHNPEIRCILVLLAIVGACSAAGPASTDAVRTVWPAVPAPVELSIGGQSALAKEALCGPLCMYMVVRLKGKPVALPAVVAATPDLSPVDGCTLRNLEAAATSLGIHMECALFDVDHLENYVYPVILYTQYQHFVVLTDPSEKQIVMLDPTKSEGWTITVEQLRQLATPYALVSGVIKPPVVAGSRVGTECLLSFAIGLLVVGTTSFLRGRHPLRKRGTPLEGS